VQRRREDEFDGYERRTERGGEHGRRTERDYDDRRTEKDYERRTERDYDRRTEKDYDRRTEKDYDRRTERDYDRRTERDYDDRRTEVVYDNRGADHHDDDRDEVIVGRQELDDGREEVIIRRRVSERKRGDDYDNDRRTERFQDERGAEDYDDREEVIVRRRVSERGREEYDYDENLDEYVKVERIERPDWGPPSKPKSEARTVVWRDRDEDQQTMRNDEAVTGQEVVLRPRTPRAKEEKDGGRRERTVKRLVIACDGESLYINTLRCIRL